MSRAVVGIISRITLNGEKEYLFVRLKRDFGKYTGCYYPPGGIIEAGETEEEALARELQEELALTAASFEKITETPSDLPGEVISWWECEVSGKIQLEDELSDARYFTVHQLKSLKLFPATRKVFRDYILKNNTM